MSKCWSCGCLMSGDSQTLEGNITCDRCGWVSMVKGESE